MTEEVEESQVIAVSEVEITSSYPTGDGGSLKETHIRVSSGTMGETLVLLQAAKDTENELYLRAHPTKPR